MPVFNEVYEAKKDQFVLIGVATSNEPDPKAFVATQGYKWVFGESTELPQKYNVQGLPTTLFLDKSGKEVKREVGAIDKATFEADLALIISPPAPAA